MSQSESQPSSRDRLVDVTTKAIDIALRAVEDEKQFHRYIISERTGSSKTETRELTFSKLDTKALKELTGVIKDLSELMRSFQDLPEGNNQTLEVVLSEEAEEFAN